MASRRIPLVLSLLLVGLLLSPGSFAQQAPGVGYDHRGRLVEQPRLKVNMFELADSAAEANREDLRIFGRWIAASLKPVVDYAAFARTQQSPAALASLKARTRAKNAASPVSLWHDMVTTQLESFEALAAQLKNARAAKVQQPDVARAMALTAKDLVAVGQMFDRLAQARRVLAKAVLERDDQAAVGSILAQVKEFAEMQEWSVASTRRQISAGVGGTPDLWLWRSQIESSEVMAVTFRDVLYVVEHGQMPPAVNQLNNHERLVAMAEWIKRAKLQVRHELTRARGSPDASPTRSRWLEGVYLNYEKVVAAEQASQEWLAANLPRFYEEIRAGAQRNSHRISLVQWDQFNAIAETQLILAIDRYRMLASMP